MNFDIIKTVKACQRRESDAQKCLYDHFAASLMGVCMRYTRSRDEAHDVLHDGFIKVLENIGQLHDPESVYAWMHSIMVNESINYLTRKRNVVYADLQQMEFDNDPTVLSNDEELDTDDYEVERVLKALAELPDKYRIVFNMRVVEEMNYVKIAEELGVSESTVRSLVYRATKMLRELLMK